MLFNITILYLYIYLYLVKNNPKALTFCLLKNKLLTSFTIFSLYPLGYIINLPIKINETDKNMSALLWVLPTAFYYICILCDMNFHSVRLWLRNIKYRSKYIILIHLELVLCTYVSF